MPDPRPSHAGGPLCPLGRQPLPTAPDPRWPRPASCPCSLCGRTGPGVPSPAGPRERRESWRSPLCKAPAQSCPSEQATSGLVRGSARGGESCMLRPPKLLEIERSALPPSGSCWGPSPRPGYLPGLCDFPGHHVPGIFCSAVRFSSPATCQWLFTHLVKPRPGAGRPWECLCPLVRDRGAKSGPRRARPLLGRLGGLNSTITASRSTFLLTEKAQPQLKAATVAWSPKLPSERRHSWIVDESRSLWAACFVRIPGTPGIQLVC